ncbi:hypothetical protein HW555_002288, partial [Spodoptera exigua]
GQEILFRSDYTYIAKQKSFYKVHQQPETWLEAKRICALEDATLFHPENAKKLKMKKGEPNNKRGNEDCVAILGDGLLNDSDCNLKKHFVCKKPLHSVHWNSKCNMSNSGYTFNEYTGNCYKFHTKPMTWFDAYRTCIMEQSNLAMIDSELQRNLLRNLTKDAVTIRIQEAYQKGIFHLGFHNRYDHGWETTKGKPLEMVPEENWWGGFYPGEGCHNKCGAMFYNGYLVNINCQTKSLFICEHQLNNQVKPDTVSTYSFEFYVEVLSL